MYEFLRGKFGIKNNKCASKGLNRPTLGLSLLLFISSINLNADIIEKYRSGFLEKKNNLDIVHVKGTESEMGIQYGYLLANRLKDASVFVKNLASNRQPFSLLPGFISTGIQKLIGWIFWTQFESSSKIFLRGVVKGAKKKEVKLSIYDLAFLNSMIDIAGMVQYNTSALQTNQRKFNDLFLKTIGLDWIKANCDSFAAWGPRTVGGKTYQTRNTDVEVGIGLENFALVAIYKPTGKIPYASAGFVGQIGVFTGMNAYGVGAGQIWSFSKEIALGNPWQLQMKDVMAVSHSSAEAAAVLESLGNRTYGNNFVFADKDGNGLAIETTPSEYSIFTSDDPREDLALWQGAPYGLRLKNAVVRGDCALDPKIRAKQTASGGPDGDPRIDEAYILRYKGQVDRIKDFENQNILIGKEQAEKISRETAIKHGSLQTAVYANTDREFWVSYAKFKEDGSVEGAYLGKYEHVPFKDYLATLKYKANGLPDILFEGDISVPQDSDYRIINAKDSDGTDIFELWDKKTNKLIDRLVW